jgi:tRNA(Ile)-lysidine synthase
VETGPASRIVVAFSGGLDSTVLLHALVQLGLGARIEAHHVDHGLHADSPRWAAHCADVARLLGVPCSVHRVDAGPGPGESPEAAARGARYRALEAQLETGDTLVTAHHGDDQLETVLLRLLRGSGIRGLTAIRTDAACGRGRLVRPLLDFSRDEIERQARAMGLAWLEDPSNRDTAFDRNYLRTRVLPAIVERWPASRRLSARLARHMTEAESLLETLAAEDCADIADPGRLPLETLQRLDEARQTNLLRHVIRALELPVPDARQLAELRSALAVRADAQVRVSWPGAEARVYRGHLYLMRPIEPVTVPDARLWLSPGADWSGPAGCCRLVPSEACGIPDAWARAGLELRFRAGGERFRPARGAYRKPLKQWFQEQGIVPWMRSRIPLLYSGDLLVAVADIGLSGDLPDGGGDGPFWKLRWTDHPPLR